MLKKTITYSDLDGNDVVEDFYFNLSKAELAEMEIRNHQEGGFVGHLKRIIENMNGDEIIDTFQWLIRKSVGRRSEDGKRFVKNDEISDEFMQTDAYSILFMELVTDADAAAAFVRGIVPKDLADKVDKGERVTDVQLPADKENPEKPAWIRENREPTHEELQSMSQDELREAFRRRNIKGNT